MPSIQEPQPIKGRELRKNLKLVTLAAAIGYPFFTAVGVPIGGIAFTKYAIELGLNNFQLGLIMAMAIMGTVTYIFSSYLIEKTGRRKTIFLVFGILHRLIWIPIALLPVFINLNQKLLIFWLMALMVTISSACSSVVQVAFFSWMGDLVPAKIKGRFFSVRTMVFTATGAASGVCLGLFIDHYRGIGRFTAVFIIIAIFGLIDILCYFFIGNPQVKRTENAIPFRKLILEPFKDKNYIRLITCAAIWNFGVNFPAPFFNMYMFKHLNMSSTSAYVLNSAIASITTVIIVRFWGKIADRYGNKPLAYICCMVISTIPLLWAMTTEKNYFIVVPILSVLVGAFWPGCDMSFVNMSIWLAPKKSRSAYLANYTIINSIFGMGAAFFAGSFFINATEPLLIPLKVPFVFGQTLNGYHLLFIISTLIRLSAAAFLLPRVFENGSKPAKRILFDLAGIKEKTYLSKIS